MTSMRTFSTQGRKSGVLWKYLALFSLEAWARAGPESEFEAPSAREMQVKR